MDMTQDGIPDLVATNNAGYLSIVPGLGGRSFGTAMNFGLFGAPLTLVAGDFDGDGGSDLLVISASGAFVLRNQAAPALRIEARISFTSPLGRGSGTITWTTNAERNLRGFNVLKNTPRGTRTINDVLLVCEECVTGVGATRTTCPSTAAAGIYTFKPCTWTGGRRRSARRGGNDPAGCIKGGCRDKSRAGSMRTPDAVNHAFE